MSAGDANLNTVFVGSGTSLGKGRRGAIDLSLVLNYVHNGPDANTLTLPG
jgi:hypothetical protein